VTEIDTLFDLLDAWRHFPSYPLERRADLYFALYLPEVLETQFGFPVQPQLVPEFPLRIGTLDPTERRALRTRSTTSLSPRPGTRPSWWS
jgi:hypothetical protein